MVNKFLRITHAADLQVKDRNIPLFKSSEETLKCIEEYIRSTQIPIHVISGDLFEYCNPNDSERKLIYNHISRLLSIETLKELVIIAGNHDLVKENKQDLNQKGFNPISIFSDVIKHFDSNKLVYCQSSGIYNSRVCSDINYVVYSLEDGPEVWKTLKDENQLKTGVNICLYHAMIREYVEYDKLPVPNHVVSKLDNLDLFPNNSIVFAGDIHKTLVFEDKNNLKRFVYPGSTMQHTFGEGTYIDVSNDYSCKHADKKYIMEYYIPVEDFETYKTINYSSIYDMKIYQHELKDFVSYNTIQLDSKVPFEVIKHNLETKLDFRIGLNQTFVKVKSSNIFITKEKEIYEVINKYAPLVNISFEYDKFVQKDNGIDNALVQNIIEQKSSELKSTGVDADIISSENIDNLLLTEEQLSKLFDSVLVKMVQGVSDNFDKEVTEKDVHDEILSLFGNQLQKTTELSSARYNIKFDLIETNGFMLLGPNRIQLDIPGIVRILGTNGIGKTTLYRMIRWCITGQVFENMSANQVVKNNLLVFNKKLIDNDFVFVKMQLNINGQIIVISRAVTRTWKQNTTDEQKLEQNWTDFIANVKRDFKMEIFPRNGEGEPKVFVGEQAEKSISKWFGSTVDNILFLNQGKIESILKSNPDKLNELILNYIGVDYLDKLEGNLDSVKSELLEIAKPKRKREEIYEAIIDADIFVKNTEKEIVDVQNKIDVQTEEKEKKHTLLESLNNQLISIGDISKQIKDKQSTENEYIAEINELSSKELTEKVKPEFTVVKPIQDTKSIELQQQEITKYQSIIDDTRNKINDCDIEKQKQLESIISVYDTLVNDCNSEIENINSSITVQKTERSKQFNFVYEKISSIRKQLEEKEQEKFGFKAKYLSENNKLQETIDSLKDQLSSGICPTCKRPMDDIEDWEAHKASIEKQIEECEKTIVENKAEIATLDEWFEKAQKVKDNYTTYERLANVENMEVFNHSVKSIDEYKQPITECTEKISLLEGDVQKVNEVKQISEYIKLIQYDDYKVESYLGMFNQKVQDVINSVITQRKALSKKKNEFNKIIIDNESLITECKQKIDNIKDLYSKALETYNNAFENWKKEVEEIETYNKSIQESKQKLSDCKLKLSQVQIDIKKLEIDLPKYNELLSKRDEVQQEETTIDNDLKVLQSNIQSLKIKKVGYENQQKDLRREYDDFIKYTKNNIIWKIYSKLIKTNFKDIVFEYYRTYLNNTLNYLLSDVNFKLYWNRNSELTMISCDNGIVTYQSVQQSSGMEITFLGLTLIYTIHVLNVKNSVSHIFIDEVSGTLNKGKELSYSAADYQELFVKILSKFKNKTVFIVDHNIEDIHETLAYEVIPSEKFSTYVRKD